MIPSPQNNKWAIGMNHPRATATTMGDDEPFIYKKVGAGTGHVWCLLA